MKFAIETDSRWEALCAVQSQEMYHLLTKIDQDLRHIIKYGDPLGDSCDSALRQIRQNIGALMLSIDEEV